MPINLLSDFPSTFSNNEQFLQRISGRSPETSADIIELGRSEENRPIVGFVLGSGNIQVSLLAGAHADEPVGPETLRALVRNVLEQPDAVRELLSACTLCVIPHVNPDGEARNSSWRNDWPSLESYLRYTVREKPGRDVEFCYPGRRPENRAVSGWLSSRVAEHGPFHVHASLHGMGFSDGAMLLIERNWTYRTETLQDSFCRAAAAAGLRMHDHNRKGEKGFFYVAPGFTTTPEGSAMRTYFESHGDPETAALFGDSSMEYVRSLGGDPLSIVTELPLFIVDGPSEPGRPTSYLAFKSKLPAIRERLAAGRDASDLWAPWGLDRLPIETASRLQAIAIEEAIQTVVDG